MKPIRLDMRFVNHVWRCGCGCFIPAKANCIKSCPLDKWSQDKDGWEEADFHDR